MEAHYDFLTLNDASMMDSPEYHGWQDVYDTFDDQESTLAVIRAEIEHQHEEKFRDRSFMFCDPQTMMPFSRLHESMIKLEQAYKMGTNRVRQLYFLFTPASRSPQQKSVL